MTIPTNRTVVVNPPMASGQVSPKVSWPAISLLGIGVVLVVLHFILGDSDNTLLNVGLSAVGASGLVTGVGYSVKVGRVELPVATGGTTHRISGIGAVAPGQEFPEV